ncbi:flagellar brake protein [Bacillus sp. EAC]|uniref:flagellar brake protein n=1 Tax=Bacillus sp. EAC TaxID=1978338 RepID=UPI000B437075|nr:flagellar brake domain-containing protein [Bacillus sp. EAC]
MLNVGDVLILEDIEAKELKRYKSKIVEIKDEELYIDYPFDESTGKASFLLNNQKLKAYIVTKENNVFTFYTTIVGRKKIEIPVMIMSFPGNDSLEKTQRRRFVRVPSQVDVAVHPLFDDFTPFTSVSLDISAGGIAILAPIDKEFNVGKTIVLWLVLPFEGELNRYVNAKAHIIRVDEKVADGKQRVSFEFDGLTPIQRQTLIQFSFDQQLKHRRKGIKN